MVRLMLARFEHYWDLVCVLVAKDLKLRYKSTVLGYAWSVLNPLAMALVFYFAFRIVARIPSESPYILVLVTGLFPWQWFTNAVQGGAQYFLAVGGLIKKNRFPKLLVVFSGVAHEALHFWVSIPVVVGFMAFFGIAPHWNWLWWIPLLSVVTFGACIGMAALVGTVNVFFRDLERLVGVLLTIWFYLSPVMFEMKLFEDRGLGWVMLANPMAALIVCWRSVFLEGRVDTVMFAAAAGWAVVMLGLGLSVYRGLHWRFAELV